MIETARPFYDTVAPVGLSVGGLGDVNNDGVLDFAIGDSLSGRQLNIFRGRTSSDNFVETATFTESADLFQVGMATPLLPGHVSANQTLSLPQTGTVSVAQAAGLEGVNSNEGLASARSIGDINGDRFEDFFFQGNGTASQYGYIVFGPASLATITNIQDRADLIVNLGDSTNVAVNPVLGRLVDGTGDLDGDGRDDLVFYRTTGADLLTTTIFGAGVLPRELSKIQLYNSDADRIRYGVSKFTGWGNAFGVSMLDWDGGRGATGNVRTEFALSRSTGAEVYRNDNFILGNVATPYTMTTTANGDRIAVVTANQIAMSIGDVNGDGRDDIGYVGSVASGIAPVMIALGGGILPQWNGGSVAQPSGTSSRLVALGDTNQDGYSEFSAVRQDTAGDDSEVIVYRGSADTVSLATSIRRNGPTENVSVTLTPSLGDFNGDENQDLAILESIRSTSGSTPISGRVYVFTSIASKFGASNITLANADSIIDSNPSTGILSSIASSSNADLDADGLDDLIVGASSATGTLNSVRSIAGRVFVIEGARKQVQIPNDGIDVLTNRTITGSGDYLVDRATGQPESFTRSLSGSQSEKWFKFTTLGDGLPGNSIGVTTSGIKPINLAPQFAGTLKLTDGSAVAPAIANTVSVGPLVKDGPRNVAIFEYDLSPLQRLLADDPNSPQIDSIIENIVANNSKLNLSYTSANLNFPSSFNLSQRAVVNGILYFVGASSSGLQLWRTDGTIVGTYKVLNGIAPFSMTATDNLLAVDSDNDGTAEVLYFTINNQQVVKRSVLSSGVIQFTSTVLSGVTLISNLTNLGHAGGSISSIDNPAAAAVTVTTESAHGLVNGDVVDLTGVTGNPSLNGRWAVTVVTPTTFQLLGSNGTGVTATGGVWEKVADAVFFTATENGASRLWLLDSSIAGASKVISEHSLAKSPVAPNQLTVGTIGATKTLFFSAQHPDALSATGSITSATSSNGFPITITTLGNHGLANNDPVEIAGNSAAAGRWTITVIAPNQFLLQGSIGTGSTVAGGTWSAPKDRLWSVRLSEIGIDSGLTSAGRIAATTILNPQNLRGTNNVRSALATGGSVFFTAVAASQKSLFSYDSTNVVAASVNTIVSFGATDSISQLVDVGEKLFFVQGGSNFLYVYNGINTTQAKVVDANNVTGFENVLFADQLTRVGTSKLFLSAQNMRELEKNYICSIQTAM